MASPADCKGSGNCLPTGQNMFYSVLRMSQSALKRADYPAKFVLQDVVFV